MYVVQPTSTAGRPRCTQQGNSIISLPLQTGLLNNKPIIQLKLWATLLTVFVFIRWTLHLRLMKMLLTEQKSVTFHPICISYLYWFLDCFNRFSELPNFLLSLENICLTVDGGTYKKLFCWSNSAPIMWTNGCNPVKRRKSDQLNFFSKLHY